MTDSALEPAVLEALVRYAQRCARAGGRAMSRLTPRVRRLAIWLVIAAHRAWYGKKNVYVFYNYKFVKQVFCTPKGGVVIYVFCRFVGVDAPPRSYFTTPELVL